MFENQLVEKPTEIAKAFNINFTTIGLKLAEKVETKESDDPLKYLNLNKTTTSPCHEFQPVDPNTIENKIKS